jgi:uncharacterized protein YkwD
MKKTALFLSFLFFSIFVFSQENVDFKHFDDEKLSILIFNGINEVREKQKLSALTKDVILTKAASFHAEYLQKNGKLTHYQTKDKYKKPVNRVRAFGGKHSVVLENIAYQQFQSNTITYEDLAAKFVKQWVNSSGHYKNIVNTRVNETGVAVFLDEKSGKLYAAQVFGKINSVDAFLDEVPANAYGIDYSNEKYDQKCTRCKEVMARKPQEVLYGLYNMDGDIIFSINDPEYFFKIFQHSGDGIAVDIMSRDQYACGGKNKFAGSAIHKGYLLPPVYFKELKANSYQDENGNIYVKIGEVPDKLKSKEIELNMLLLQDKFLCIYNPFFDIPGSRWDLLDMGMFLDSAQKIKNNNDQITVTTYRELKFEIPFEKNVSEYSPADIQPIYDSLKLDSYTITKIDIRAYSSVEGTTERNIILQEKRAASIVKALSEIQSEEIPQTTSAKENWVEFYQDVPQTKYVHLARMSHEQIKVELKNETTSRKLEPMLSKHRKAVVFLTLERKSVFNYTSPEKSVQLFNAALSTDDVETAMEIQQEVFDKIQDNKAPTDLMDKLELPNKKEFGLLLNNKAMLTYQLDSLRLRSSIDALLELEKLVPKSPEVKYNIVALELRAWANGDAAIFPNRLSQKIDRLANYGIHSRLITRMQINYNIIYSEYLMRDRKYKEKNRVISLINMKYRKLNLSNNDVLNLAQYFVSYNAYDLAIQLLHPHVTKVDVDEDLLFYYLNLTIIDKKITAQTYYRTIMMNAVNINGERFCKLFNTFGKGGITFQLLDNLYLKKTYCESCQ